MFRRRFSYANFTFYLLAISLMVGGLLLIATSLWQHLVPYNPEIRIDKTSIYSAAVHYLFRQKNSSLNSSGWQTIYITPRQTTIDRTHFVYSKVEGDSIPVGLLSALSDISAHVEFGDANSMVLNMPGQFLQMPDHTIALRLGPLKPQANGTITVIAEYYIASLNGGGYEVTLDYDSKGWHVQRVTSTWIT